LPDCEHPVRAGVSDDQRPLRIIRFFGADMLDPLPPIGAQEIKTETVLLRINLIDQPLTQPRPLGWINRAFKNGKLNPLTEILARLGNPAQPPLPLRLYGGDVITHDNQHSFTLFPDKGGIPVQIAPKKTGQEQGLHVKQYSNGNFFFDKGVIYLILFSYLIGNQ